MVRTSQPFRRRAALAILVSCLLGVAFLPQPAWARKADIVNMTVGMDGDMVVIGFRVDGAFSQSITDAIHSGAPTSFTYIVELFRQEDAFADERIVSTELERTIQYDTLKRHYVITESNNQKVARDLAAAELLMTDVRDIPVAVSPNLVPGAKYYVMVKAKLGEVELPFFFSFLRFFVQLWDFETRWTRIDLPVIRAD
jgi:hypothetical protein